MQNGIKQSTKPSKTKKLFLAIALLYLLVHLGSGFAEEDPEYQLYTNDEKFGIVVFPKQIPYADLDGYIQSIDFNLVESGKAAMRYGSKGENTTFMMPLEIQKKHSIEKFIVLQVLPNLKLMVGIYDPEWGLTLPDTLYSLEEAKKNIPETLKIFRKSGDPQPKIEIDWEQYGDDNRISISWQISKIMDPHEGKRAIYNTEWPGPQPKGLPPVAQQKFC
jgi:hypothetical protein